MTHPDPVWRTRLARDDAAAAVREAAEYHSAVTSGLATEPDIVFTRSRRVRARRRLAYRAWLWEGYGLLRGA